MIGKAQKSHGERSELNSVFGLEKVDRWNPIRTSAIQSRERFRADDDEVKVFVQRWLNEQQIFLKEHNQTARAMVKVYRGTVRVCREVGITFSK
jgi:hypothetical protein